MPLKRKQRILYMSTNDGSDMRINKEIRTLSKVVDVYFLGVGNYSEHNYARDNCRELILIEHKGNSLKAIVLHVLKFLKLQRKHKFHSIHIINEQLMIFFYLFLFQKNAVLDLFDSIFLKLSKPNEKYRFLKKLIYAPANTVLVTDENRRTLMPEFIKKKLIVLENYPYVFRESKKKKTPYIKILYNGSLSTSRGTGILKDLVNSSQEVKVIMAGWLNDQDTIDFSKHPSVDNRGTITQSEATRVAAEEADYIMCCYEPNNQNNINASPNKIFDAIQTNTPIIINSEVKISKFVADKKIGIVIDSFYQYDSEKMIKMLKEKKGTFAFDKDSKKKYSWENIESKLLAAHKLI